MGRYRRLFRLGQTGAPLNCFSSDTLALLAASITPAISPRLVTVANKEYCHNHNPDLACLHLSCTLEIFLYFVSGGGSREDVAFVMSSVSRDI